MDIRLLLIFFLGFGFGAWFYLCIGVHKKCLSEIKLAEEKEWYVPFYFFGRVLPLSIMLSLPAVPIANWLYRLVLPNQFLAGVLLLSMIAAAPWINHGTDETNKKKTKPYVVVLLTIEAPLIAASIGGGLVVLANAFGLPVWVPMTMVGIMMVGIIEPFVIWRRCEEEE